jgi:polyisoprenoid-binding protein YceI
LFARRRVEEAVGHPNHPDSVRVEVRIAADSLRDHQPKLSAKDIAKVERQVRDAEILDAARFPKILFEAGQLEAAHLPSGATGEFRGKIAGMLTLHGQSRLLQFPIQGRIAGERLEANATTTPRPRVVPGLMPAGNCRALVSCLRLQNRVP